MLSIFAGYRILPYVNDYKEYTEFFLNLNNFGDLKNSNFENYWKKVFWGIKM